jgi:hypothetical protein
MLCLCFRPHQDVSIKSQEQEVFLKDSDLDASRFEMTHATSARRPPRHSTVFLIVDAALFHRDRSSWFATQLWT